MIKSAADAVKTASVAKTNALQKEDKLIERAGKALKNKGARKIALHMLTNPREPFGKVTLLSVDTLRSLAAGALGSSAHTAVNEFWSRSNYRERLAEPLLKMLDEKGYGARLAIDDRTWTSEESGNTYGAKHLTLEWWPKPEVAAGA